MSGIKKAATASLLMHIAFLLFLLLSIRQTTLHLPEHYTVTLISRDAGDIKGTNTEYTIKETSLKAGYLVKSTASKEVQYKKDSLTEIQKQDSQYKDDRIALMSAKKHLKQRQRLREEISISKQGGASQTYGADNSFLRLGDAISQAWFPPGIEQKGIEAVVRIRAMKNGVIQIVGFEKPSENIQFNESVLRAIRRTSPFEPMPYEEELLLRFTDED